MLAIACGVVEGKGLGQNARAALIAPRLRRNDPLRPRLGRRRETLAGLSGLGDLVLTCSSTSSRNYLARQGHRRGPLGGRADGRPAGPSPKGAFTAPVLARLAREKGIDMPIVDAVDALLAGRASVDEVLERLLSRPPRAEGGLEIDRDALLLPVAVAGGVEPFSSPGRRAARRLGSGPAATG